MTEEVATAVPQVDGAYDNAEAADEVI